MGCFTVKQVGWSVRQVFFWDQHCKVLLPPTANFQDMTCGSNFCFAYMQICWLPSIPAKKRTKNEGCCSPAVFVPYTTKQECNCMTLCQEDQNAIQGKKSPTFHSQTKPSVYHIKCCKQISTLKTVAETEWRESRLGFSTVFLLSSVPLYPAACQQWNANTDSVNRITSLDRGKII